MRTLSISDHALLAPKNATVTGGAISEAGGYRYHTFTSAGDLIVAGGTVAIDYFIIGGGGGGGGYVSGGGGGGGGIAFGSESIATGTYPVVIGAGGAAGPATITSVGGNGGSSSFNSHTANGGGGGGGNGLVGQNGANGGGGGGRKSTAGGTGTYNGGAARSGDTVNTGAGGGGGGAAANGTNGTTGNVGGNGGIGVSPLWSSDKYGSGGGGGSGGSGTSGGRGLAGSLSGGGGGGATVSGGQAAGESAAANTGAGGGGSGGNGGITTGGVGGSGIVIIRYPIDYYLQTVLADSPLGFWPLNETSGSTATGSVGGRNLTYRNSPTLAVAGPGGRTGVTFNGTNQTADSADQAAFARRSSDAWSIEAWIKYTDTGTSIKTFLTWRGTTAVTEDEVGSLSLNDGVAGRLSVGAPTGALSRLKVHSDGGWNDGEWHHVVGTGASGQPTKLYVDGVLRGTDTTARYFNNSNARRVAVGSNIASTNTYSQHASCSVTVAAIYGIELTAAQVLAHYTAAGL
jgi:hypothetical protein